MLQVTSFNGIENELKQSSPIISTYMSIVVQSVIGEFHLVEHNRLGGPMRTEGGTVRMKAEPLRALWLGATRRNPLGSAKLEPTVADGHHLEQHAVIGVRVQSVHGKAHRGKHSPARRKERKAKDTCDE